MIFKVWVGDRNQPAGFIEALSEWEDASWETARQLAIKQTAFMGLTDATYECITLEAADPITHTRPYSRYFTPPPLFWVNPIPEDRFFEPDDSLGDGCNDTHLTDGAW